MSFVIDEGDVIWESIWDVIVLAYTVFCPEARQAMSQTTMGRGRQARGWGKKGKGASRYRNYLQLARSVGVPFAQAVVCVCDLYLICLAIALPSFFPFLNNHRQKPSFHRRRTTHIAPRRISRSTQFLLTEHKVVKMPGIRAFISLSPCFCCQFPLMLMPLLRQPSTRSTT